MEIELKILEINVSKVIEQLPAKKSFEGEISAEFFLNPDGKKIRLRKLLNKNILTYKIIHSDDEAIKNKEIEIEFNNYKKTARLLKLLGFKKYGQSKKHRLSYYWEGIHFDIDTLANIPTFIEIESDSFEKVKKGVEIIGYKLEDTVRLTERTLKEHYLKN